MISSIARAGRRVLTRCKLERRDYLEGYEFALHSVYTGGARPVREGIEGQQPDLVVLDILLPERDGLEVLRDLRQRHPRLPVIMLTARGEETDRIVGLELGADDYLAKPFNPRELLARIRAILRRSGEAAGAPATSVNPGSANDSASAAASDAPGPPPLQSGNIEVDRARLECRVDGVIVELAGAELQILATLLETPGQVLSRDELMNRTKGRDYMGFERSIDVHISRLRTRLEQAGAPDRIKTVRGAGYQLVLPERE